MSETAESLYQHQDYPKMLFHVALEPRTVNTAEEHAKLAAEGWEESPVKRNRLAALNGQIAWHETEAARLRVELKTLEDKAESETPPAEVRRGPGRPRSKE